MEGNGKSLKEESENNNWCILMQNGRRDYRNNFLKSAAKAVVMANNNLNGGGNFEWQNLGEERDQKLAACSSSLKNNALGCIYFRMNKPNLALVYFRKAMNDYSLAMNLSLADPQARSKQPSIYCQNFAYRLTLLHNCGVALLQIRQPAAAFDCLMEVITVVNNNARLWLRLAECCIMANKMSNRKDFELNERKRNIVKDIVGVGPHRKVVLNTNSSGLKFSSSGEQGAIPALSLEFAHFCLKNALAVLQDFDPDSVTAAAAIAAANVASPGPNNAEGGPGGSPESTTAKNQGFDDDLTNPFNVQTSAREKYFLKSSILCATAYVCLCLGDSHTALQSAKSLLNQKLLSEVHILLGHLYAAEALILSDKLTDALYYLKIDPLNLTQNHYQANNTIESNYFPKQQSFRTILGYNLAATYACQQEFDKAAQTLATISENGELPIQFTMLTLYIQIQKGQIEEARNTVTKTLLQIPSAFG